MSNCQKEENPKNFYRTSPTNLILSSLASKFLQRIQILDFLIYIYFFFWGGGGGGGRIGVRMIGAGGGGAKHEPSQISCIQHTFFVTIYISTEKDH